MRPGLDNQNRSPTPQNHGHAEPHLLVYSNESETIDSVTTAKGRMMEDKENYNRDRPDSDSCFPNFFERHLVIENNQFVIVPNGGSGDCLFKAIAQAMSEEDDDGNHMVIRCKIVDFILTRTWDKLRDSIEIQHITGNVDLCDRWVNEPMRCYKEYMTQAGTLGSFIELTAAAELLQFNFTSIQEYSKDIKTYRVENFGPLNNNNNVKPIYHFLFTGDYESGHWEHLVPLTSPSPAPSKYLDDGTYHGTLYIVIDGVQTSLDDWLGDVEEPTSKHLTPDPEHETDNGERESCSDERSESRDVSMRDGDTSRSAQGDEDLEDTTTDADEGGEDEGSPSFVSAKETNYDSSVLDVDLENNVDDQNNIGTTTNTTTTTEEGDSALSENYDETNGSDNSEWEEFTPKKPSHLFQVERQEGSKTSLLARRDYSTNKIGKMMSRGSKTSTLDSEAIDKKKGCFKTFVSYFSSILH